MVTIAGPLFGLLLGNSILLVLRIVWDIAGTMRRRRRIAEIRKRLAYASLEWSPELFNRQGFGREGGEFLAKAGDDIRFLLQ